jgi:hypothetical protein
MLSTSSEIILSKTGGLFYTFKNLLGFEALIWIVGLLFLAFINTPANVHFTICPLINLGLDFCPGCGLGSSISYLFRGDFINSFNSHPLGLFALIVLLTRIIHLLKFNWSRNGKYITTDALS